MLFRVFAYGSNLNGAQMQARCPGARFEAAVWLDGHTLDFAGWSPRWDGGVATIQKRKGFGVPGVTYVMSAEDLRRLDGYEGCPSVYRRTVVKVAHMHQKRTLEAGAYLLNSGKRARPSEKYLDTILGAYKKLGFPPMPLLEVVRACPVVAPPPRAPVVYRYDDRIMSRREWDRPSSEELAYWRTWARD